MEAYYLPVVTSGPIDRNRAESAAAHSPRATAAKVRRREPPSAAEHARRVAWGKRTGAQVAADYRELLRKAQ